MTDLDVFGSDTSHSRQLLRVERLSIKRTAIVYAAYSPESTRRTGLAYTRVAAESLFV